MIQTKTLLKFALITGTVLLTSCITPKVQNTKQITQSNYLREVISDRKISWAGSSYEYDYIPFAGYRTLLAIGENWGPTVNADLQGICQRLGGKDLAYEKDPLTEEEKPLKPANGWSFHWACVGGKDEFEVVVYRPNKYGLNYNILKPIQPDWNIVVEHKKNEPIILSIEMRKLAEKYKNADWRKFFQLQKGSLLGALWNDYGFLKAQKLENGDWIAYYDVERGSLASTQGRFYPIYQFAAYCYANGGSFVETDKDWIDFYKKKGLINTSFKCEGGSKTFLIKVEPYRIKSESVSYKIYVKNLQ